MKFRGHWMYFSQTGLNSFYWKIWQFLGTLYWHNIILYVQRKITLAFFCVTSIRDMNRVTSLFLQNLKFDQNVSNQTKPIYIWQVQQYKTRVCVKKWGGMLRLNKYIWYIMILTHNGCQPNLRLSRKFCLDVSYFSEFGITHWMNWWRKYVIVSLDILILRRRQRLVSDNIDTGIKNEKKFWLILHVISLTCFICMYQLWQQWTKFILVIDVQSSIYWIPFVCHQQFEFSLVSSIP